jgi:hypothetical protein
MTGLFVSIIHFSGTYATGLRFIQHKESDVCLATMFPGDEVLGSQLSPDSENLGGFSGFHVAVGPRGIQALAMCPVLDAYPLGRIPRGVPRMCLTARFKRTSALKGGFDVRDLWIYEAFHANGLKGFKMVTLGISDDSTDALTRMSGTGVSTLRELAQWVPDIPPESLCLNVGTFSGAQRKV